MDEEYVKNLTMAYIYSYNTAMQVVNNPNFATQVAMSVIATINMGGQIKRPMLNPFETLFAHMAKVRKQEGENDDGAEDETD